MISGLQIAEQAKQQLAKLTGLRPVTVSGLAKSEQGWQIDIEMVELARIPESEDVLATYRTVTNDAGDLMSYERVKRYYRAQVSDAA